MPPYFIFAILATIFSLANFTLLIPLLNVLFNQTTHEVMSKPEFSLTITYLKDIFNYEFFHIVDHGGKLEALKFVCLVIFFSVMFSSLFKFLSQKVLTSLRTYLIYNLRKELFQKLTKLNLGYYSNQRKGDLMSSLSNDIQEVENSIVSSVQVVMREPLMLIGFFILLLSISVKLTLFTLLLLPISFGLIAEITKRLKREAKQSQGLLGNLLSIIDESISGIRIIKAFNAQSFVNQKFDQENTAYTRLLKSIVNKRELASPLSEFLSIGVLTIIIFYGGKLVLSNEGSLSGSQFITYIALYSQVLVPAKNISSAITNIQRGLASGERIIAILDTDVSIQDAENAKEVHSFNQGIEYKNVSFAYTHGDEGYALKNVSVQISKGKTIALVGRSGGGKSTFVDLLPRFYDVTSGVISIDGIDIRDISQSSLRSNMGIVTQESILFNDTIFNNIAFGLHDAKEEDVVQAAKIANAHEFIIQSEKGYQTNIGDRGTKLSGGQRQRLSIARAVLRNPAILILDEATSALDTESEKLVQEALSNLMKNRTSIVIAHRLSTIVNADEILVLDKGEIIERGNHQMLISTDSFYKKLYEMQSFS
jgi:ATP-binding cassette, subfamily B, bacterial MsbA